MKLVMTKQRKEIIDIINNESEPIDLKTIYNKLSNKVINLTTVYRTLETLLKEDLIKFIHLNKENYYYPNNPHHHYMVCLACNKFINIPCHLLNLDHLELDNFKVLSHDLVIYGKCKDCQ